MSLVGTRPILPDELEQYELHHRARIAIKPGITGMWQVSGRSDITDFEEIVRLDTDIFSGLPEFVFENKKVDRFLNVLKNVIAMSDLEGVTLSKLHLSEYNEATISIEWIFNYFRAYFSFESDDEDSYGMIENNKENQEFSNYFRKLKPEEYELVAKSVLDYIIMMGGFGKR